MTSEEMAAKIEALEARVASLEATRTVHNAIREEEMHAALAELPVIDAEAVVRKSDRASTLTMVRGMTRPILSVVPREHVVAMIAEGSTPADLLALMSDMYAAKMPAYDRQVYDVPALAARHHGITWADLGVAPDGTMKGGS